MLAADKDALLCDLAETYGVFDLDALPVKTLAALSFGLREDSRIKMKLAGVKYPTELLLMASIRDSLAWLVWAKSKDGECGVNKPVSILDTLLQDKQLRGGHGFDTPEEFEAERKRIIESVKEEVKVNGNTTGESLCADCTIG